MFRKQARLSKQSWAFRIKRLSFALGWSYVKLARISGIRRRSLMKILADPKARGYSTRRKKVNHTQFLHIKTIKKILDLEALYRDVLRVYDKNPYLLNRREERQRYAAVKLKPIEDRTAPDMRTLGILETDSRPKNKRRKSAFKAQAQVNKRIVTNARRSAGNAQEWVRRRAKGWDWHAARAKNASGRPYYNMGRKRVLDKGLSLKDYRKRDKNTKQHIIDSNKKE